MTLIHNLGKLRDRYCQRSKDKVVEGVETFLCECCASGFVRVSGVCTIGHQTTVKAPVRADFIAQLLKRQTRQTSKDNFSLI